MKIDSDKIEEMAFKAGIDRPTLSRYQNTLRDFANIVVEECAADLVALQMKDPVFARVMDRYYESKWSHRFN